jgi:hypothetical protein
MNDETKEPEAIRRRRDAIRLAGEGMRDVLATQRSEFKGRQSKLAKSDQRATGPPG